MKLQITIDGKQYEVDVELPDGREPAAAGGYVNPYAAPIVPPTGAAPGTGVPPTPPPANGNGKSCRSPMAGVVVRVNVQPGQQIQANDLLIVLEAMKMETNVTAPSAGTVGEVLVKAGDPVQVDQVVVELA